MIRYPFALLLLPLFLLAAQPVAAALPAPFKAKFTVSADGFQVGELHRTLRRDASGDYVLETDMQPTGLVALFKNDRFVERSRWSAEGQQPVPHEYIYRHTNSKNETLERLEFDWQRKVVRSLRDGETTVVPVRPGVMDKLSYQAALRRDLGNGLEEMTYEVADRGDIRDYRFRVVGQERLKTALGEFDTIKVERISNNADRKTFLWCAINLDYTLVRITQVDDGHTFASDIIELEGIAMPAGRQKAAAEPPRSIFSGE